MAAFETIEARLELAADGFSSAVDNAVQNLGTLENRAGGAHKAVGALGVAMAGAAAGGIAKSVSASMDLQSALNESQAIMGDLTQNEMKQMEDAAREVGRTTTFSAEEAGQSFYYLASAGMDAEQSVASMGDVAQFAQAGMFDLETATDLATDAQSALGMSSDDAAENAENLNQVMDVLVKSNTLANASVEEFSESLTNKAAASMRQVGMEVEEGASALAVFADQGLKGRRAGTILARTIEGLQSSAQDNAAAFEELGVSVYDADGNMRPMADIVEDMDGALQGMSTEQRNAAMEQLGLNERAAQGINLLSGNADQMREYEGELQNAGGTAEEVANNQLQSLSAQWDIFKSQITDVAISIGNNLLPPLTAMLSFISDGIGIFQRINESTDGWAGTVTLLATLVTGLTMAAGSLSAIIGAGGLATAVAAASGAVGGLVTAFSILTGPIGLAVAAVSALAYAFINDFAGIRTQTMRVVQALRGVLGPIFQQVFGLAKTIINDFAQAFGGMGSGAESTIARLVTALGDWLVGAITRAGAIVSNWLTRMQQWWSVHGDTVIAVVQRLAQGVRMAFQIMANGIRVTIMAIRAIFGPFIDWLGAMWAQHGEKIMSEARTTWAVVRRVVAGFVEWARPYVNGFVEFLSGIFQWGLNAIQRFWSVWGEDIMATLRMVVDAGRIIIEQFIDHFSTVISAGLAIIRGDWNLAWQYIESYLLRTIGRIEELVGGWVDVLVGYIKTFVEDGIAWFKDLYRRLVGGSIIPDMLSDIKSAFSSFFSDLIGSIGDFAGDVVQDFKDLASDAVDALLDKVGDFKSAGKSLVTAVGDGIRDNVNKVKGKVEGAAQTIRDYWPSSPAEEGPLSDIDRIGPGMMRTIADSIESSSGMVERATASATQGARKTVSEIIEDHGEFDSGAFEEAIGQLSDTQRRELADMMADTKWVDHDYQAMAGMRQALEGDGQYSDLSQAVFDAVASQSGVDADAFDRLVETPDQDPNMAQAEDGSMVPASFYDTAPSAARNNNTNNDSGSGSSDPVVFDFRGLDDDAMISIGDLEDLINDALKDREHAIVKSASDGDFAF